MTLATKLRHHDVHRQTRTSRSTAGFVGCRCFLNSTRFGTVLVAARVVCCGKIGTTLLNHILGERGWCWWESLRTTSYMDAGRREHRKMPSSLLQTIASMLLDAFATQNQQTTLSHTSSTNMCTLPMYCSVSTCLFHQHCLRIVLEKEFPPKKRFPSKKLHQFKSTCQR